MRGAYRKSLESYLARAALCNVLCVYASLAQSPSAHSATASATVSVNIISTISLNNVSSLVFGDISSSAAAGTVVLNSTGSRVATGGVTINTAIPGGIATFDVTGDPYATYTITLPASVTLTNSLGNSMLVDNFTSTPSLTGQLGAGGQQNLQVGGTLNVASNQIYGAYAGMMSVTVEYN